MADDKTPADLTPAASLEGDEVVHVVQGGNSRKASLQRIMNEVAHAHAIDDVTGLQDALAAKLDDSQAGAAGLAILAADDESGLLAALGLNTAATLATSTAAEVLTGTAADRAVTPDALAALWERGTDVVSAGTVSLGEGGYFAITGTTTITDIDFATDHAGRCAWVKFAGVLTLTHNASTLILPGGANIATAAGDTACFVSEGSDVVRCVAYTRASGAALVAGVFTPAIQSVTSSATVTPTFSNDQVNITAQAAGLTLANPTGTAVDGWGMVVRIKDNGTARSITYGTQYRALGVTLPATTVISKTLYLGMIFNNADTKWDVIAVAQEA